MSLVSEGACLAALHLQQFSSVEWGMDGQSAKLCQKPAGATSPSEPQFPGLLGGERKGTPS